MSAPGNEVGEFRKEVEFNSTVVILQILGVQAGYYLTQGILFLIVCLLYNAPFDYAYLFDWRLLCSFSIESLHQNVCPVIFILTSLTSGCIGGYLIKLIVGRTLKCPDFCFTAFLIHIIITWLFSDSFPACVIWWFVSSLSFFLMMLLGIWFCSREELLPIHLPTTLKSPSP